MKHTALAVSRNLVHSELLIVVLQRHQFGEHPRSAPGSRVEHQALWSPIGSLWVHSEILLAFCSTKGGRSYISVDLPIDRVQISHSQEKNTQDSGRIHLARISDDDYATQ
jgi:hypothetical protein